MRMELGELLTAGIGLAEPLYAWRGILGRPLHDHGVFSVDWAKGCCVDVRSLTSPDYSSSSRKDPLLGHRC